MDIVKRIKKRGEKMLFLCVLDTSKSAIVFYERHGFKFHSKITLDVLFLKEELKGMNKIMKELNEERIVAT